MMEDLTAGMGFRPSRFGYRRVTRIWTRLTLVEDLGGQPYGQRGQQAHMVRCRCDCGAEVEVRLGGLRNGTTRSCGCLQRDTMRQIKTTHGQTDTRLHRIWRAMRTRCQNRATPSYVYYGARGITVDPHWDRFEPFRDWALLHGYRDTLSIDRIDNNGPYSPENCRWITMSEQQRNTRQNRILTAWGESKSLITWAEDDRCQATYSGIRHHLKAGWTGACYQPSDGPWSNHPNNSLQMRA